MLLKLIEQKPSFEVRCSCLENFQLVEAHRWYNVREAGVDLVRWERCRGWIAKHIHVVDLYNLEVLGYFDLVRRKISHRLIWQRRRLCRIQHSRC